MAGTKRGTIDALMAEGDEFANAEAAFQNIYDLLTGHPNTTLISLSWGAGGTAATFGNWGTNAFFVFRFDTNAGRDHAWYLFVKCNITSSQAIAGVQVNGQTPSSGNGQIFASAAVGIGGDENPWQGTTDADGADTHPTQFWDAPSAGTAAQVVPASNSTSGTDGTNRENGLLVFDQSTYGDMRYHVVADDDAIIFGYDDGDNGSYSFYVLGALENPNPGITWDALPLCSAGHVQSDFGTTATSTDLDKHGCVHPDGTEASWECLECSVYSPNTEDTQVHPNDLSTAWDFFYLNMASRTTGASGWVGVLPMVRWAYNFPTNDTDTDMDWISLGTITVADGKVMFPWDGATTPQSSLDRNGVDFP